MQLRLALLGAGRDDGDDQVPPAVPLADLLLSTQAAPAQTLARLLCDPLALFEPAADGGPSAGRFRGIRERDAALAADAFLRAMRRRGETPTAFGLRAALRIVD
eukprot:Polyplicarium_translucidae@DN3675_c0_g1_i1.p3